MLAQNWKIYLAAIALIAAAWMMQRSLKAPLALPSSNAPASNASAQRGANAAPADKQQKRGGPKMLAEVDPTLRLDLLDASRSVEYKGASRNIFEVYAPPPPPTPPKPTAPPQITAPPVATAPKPPDLPLKFYGIAQPAGSNIKQAFLTDGEEILIAKEGDVVAKYYKINRIGVTSMEIEDIRTRKPQALPLIEE